MLDDTPWTLDDEEINDPWAEITLGVGEDGFVVAAYGCEIGREALLADTLQEIVDELRAEIRRLN